jgi:hypothetical protein
VFVNGALNSLKVVLPNAPPDQLAQLIAGTSSALLDGLDASTLDNVLRAIVLALRKVYVKLKRLQYLQDWYSNRFIPVYVGAAVALICGVFMKVLLSWWAARITKQTRWLGISQNQKMHGIAAPT